MKYKNFHLMFLSISRNIYNINFINASLRIGWYFYRKLKLYKKYLKFFFFIYLFCHFSTVFRRFLCELPILVQMILKFRNNKLSALDDWSCLKSRTLSLSYFSYIFKSSWTHDSLNICFVRIVFSRLLLS